MLCIFSLYMFKVMPYFKLLGLLWFVTFWYSQPCRKLVLHNKYLKKNKQKTKQSKTKQNKTKNPKRNDQF